MSSKAFQGRVVGAVNWIGLLTLIKREVNRFTSIGLQTVVAPVVTSMMFYAIFALAFGGVSRQIGDVPFLHFLAPGLIMMSMVQNAFANTSSSLVIAKIQGNIVDILMPPLSSVELLIGLLAGGVARGLVIGVCAMAVMSLFVPMTLHSVPIIIAFAVLGTMMLSAVGIAAGIWAQKFDHIASVTNFVITPLTFLSGTFYSVQSLPGMWHVIATYNPFFYMIDGFRAGFIGHADGSIFVGLSVLCAVNILLIGLVLWMLRTGYKVKS